MVYGKGVLSKSVHVNETFYEKNFLNPVDGRMGKRRRGSTVAGGWELRVIQRRQGFMLKEAMLPASSEPETLEGAHVRSKCSHVTAAFPVCEHESGL